MSVVEVPQVANAALSLEGVSRWYGNVVAVNDISFSLGPGLTGLLGPNGAGKSTLLHMLAGVLKPSSGEAKVMGQSAWRNPDIYRQIGLVPEREAIYPFLTGFEFVRLSARLHDLPDVDAAANRALDQVELNDVKDRAVGGYSKGMKQRVKIAAAIVHDPAILLLDEPFNGADPRQRLRMMDMLRQMADSGATIVFSSHILEEVERLASSVLVIVAGRLAAAGDFHEIRQLMTDRPHSLMLRTSDNRGLAAALINRPFVYGIEIQEESMAIQTSDLGSFVSELPGVAKDNGVSLFELSPTDESLESVFSYLVSR